MELALYQPEIPQNVGTLLRLGACLDIAVHIIEPCGFLLTDKRLKRSGMDYLDTVNMYRHSCWQEFWQYIFPNRCIILSPHASQAYYNFQFSPTDVFLVGQESCGLPNAIIKLIPNQVIIPMKKELRSLNVALAASIVLGEALRQTKSFPTLSAS